MSTDGQKQSQQAPQQPAEIGKAFSPSDADGDGRISPPELKHAISPTPPAKSVDCQEVAARMEDLDGYVNVGELTDLPGRRDLDAKELRDTFDFFDMNGDGLISAAEMSEMLGRIGEGCSIEDCEKINAIIDVNGDGGIGFEVFKKIMNDAARP